MTQNCKIVDDLYSVNDRKENSIHVSFYTIQTQSIYTVLFME